MISRELTIEVLNQDECIGEITYISKHKNMVHIGLELDSIKKEKRINIWELLFKNLDEWIIKKGYAVLNSEPNIYRLYNKGVEVYGVETNSNVLAYEQCGEWILNNI